MTLWLFLKPTYYFKRGINDRDDLLRLIVGLRITAMLETLNSSFEQKSFSNIEPVFRFRKEVPMFLNV